MNKIKENLILMTLFFDFKIKKNVAKTSENVAKTNFYLLRFTV